MGREHWVETTLGKIATHPQYGWTTKAGQSGEFKYFRTTDINSPIDWDRVPFCVEIPNNPEEYAIRRNDILVSRAGSVGLSIRFEEDHVDTLFASYLIRFKAIPPIDSKFIAYYLFTRQYWDFIRESQSGIAVPNVNASKLSNLPVPLPPLNEQQRIVAKLDALLPKVKHAQARLAKMPGLLKKFRQSVLAAACSGRLTEDWREGKDVPCFLNNDDLPDGWQWIELEKVIPQGGIFDGPFGSNLKTSDYTTSGIRVIRLENIGHFSFFSEKETFISPEKYSTLVKHTVGEGDIIFSSFITDEIRACILPLLDHKAIAKADCFTLRLNNEDVIMKKYLLYQLVCRESFEQLTENIHGVSRPRINTKQLRQLKIKLCPVEEQHEIVRRVEQLFALADSLAAKYHKAMARVAKLEQALLAKAFRGDLAPSDPTDESAEELLKRILAEKTKLEAGKKKTRNKK